MMASKYVINSNNRVLNETPSLVASRAHTWRYTANDDRCDWAGCCVGDTMNNSLETANLLSLSMATIYSTEHLVCVASGVAGVDAEAPMVRSNHG